MPVKSFKLQLIVNGSNSTAAVVFAVCVCVFNHGTLWTPGESYCSTKAVLTAVAVFFFKILSLPGCPWAEIVDAISHSFIKQSAKITGWQVKSL